MRTRHKWGVGVAAGALFIGVGYMEQQSSYKAGVADTQQKITDAARRATASCLATAEWKDTAILNIAPRDVQLIQSGFEEIHQLPGPEVKTFLGHLGEAGLKHITIEINDNGDPSEHSNLEGAETVMEADILGHLSDPTRIGDVTFTKRVEQGLPDIVGAARIFLSDIVCTPETK